MTDGAIVRLEMLRKGQGVKTKRMERTGHDVVNKKKRSKNEIKLGRICSYVCHKKRKHKGQEEPFWNCF